ncbi:MAB_1171c family putative transporter [Streptomyces sp. NPDC059982]|uniref:MAB_1171c family putative transporter n=1 Tax=unclassified Streptomyces TaxID=2593676 RepID=UPI00368517DB
MHPVYVFTLPALLWALVIWRAPSALNGTRPSRLLWGFLVGLAVTLTARSPAVEHLIRLSTGSPDLSVLVKHLAGLASNHFILEYAITVHRRGPRRVSTARLRIVTALTAALALTTVFVLLFEHDPDGPASRVTDAHLGDWPVLLYEGIVYAYLGTSSALSAGLFWSNRRSVPWGVLRSGVVCLAGGCALTLVYTLYRVVFLARQDSHPEVPGPGTPDAVSETLPVIIILLLVAGLVLPPLRRLGCYVHDQYALWRLYPLWSDLLDAVPMVAFGPCVGRTRDLFILGDRTLDVAHRAFEIRDACLVLRGRGATARTEGPPSGSDDAPPRITDAESEAAWLFSALRTSPGTGPVGAPPPPSDARTPSEETEWLLKVATAYGQLSRGRAAAPTGAGADA